MTQKQPIVRKPLSLLLSAAMLTGLYCSASLSAKSSETDEMTERKLTMLSKATGFLKDSRHDDGRFGDDASVINETAEAVSVLLQAEPEYDAALSGDWLLKNGSRDNTDTLARYVTAFGDNSLMTELLATQNKDGGFGVRKNYSSDVLDSVLVLEAINRCSAEGYSQEGFAIVSYLTENTLASGGWGYSSGSGADPVLTAMAEYQIAGFMNARTYQSDPVSAALEKADDYLSEKTGLEFGKAQLGETLYAQLAHLAYAGKIDYKNVMEGLEQSQSVNGGFYESSHLTALAIRLLQDMNFDSTLKVYDFDTAVSPESGYFGTDCNINVNYAITYTVAADEDCTLKTTITNGKKILSENEIIVHLKENETLCSGTISDLVINQMHDDGISVVTELFEGEKLLKSSEKTITLSDPPVAGKTTLTGFTLTLDQYSVYEEYPTIVTAESELLYATNVENSLKLRYTVTTGDKIIAEKEITAALLPEKSSIRTQGIQFTPDAPAGTSYTVTAKCIYEDKVIAERSCQLLVQTLPTLPEPGEGETSSAFEINWISPVLSDYCVYAGNETDIMADVLISYLAAGDTTKNVTLRVSDDNEVIAEKTQPVSLPEGRVSMKSRTPEYPSVQTEGMLSFTVSALGTYTVTAELTEEDGTVLQSGETTVTVMDRPQQDLILNSTVSEDGNNLQSVDLSWNDISCDAESYSYGLKRRIKGQEWESRSIWNESEKVRVLNAYPLSPYLQSWMTNSLDVTQEPAGKGLFDITSVYMRDFNANPEKYMKDESGRWKYDVVFLGSSDANSYFDLSEAACNVMHQFADYGGGILFGHDTIRGPGVQRYFSTFVDDLGIKIIQEPYYNTSTSVSVVKIGTLTNFPWTIRGTLTIPSTHSTDQYCGGNLPGTEWMSLNTGKRVDSSTNSHTGTYLVTNKNLGMIQTGHSNGQATDDERKVLANTLFYLHQKSRLTTARDSSFYDKDAPDAPTASEVTVSGSTAKVNVHTVDRPTVYEYYIEAAPESNPEDEPICSNVETRTAFADLKGYVVGINDSEASCPELIVYDENHEVVQNVIASDPKGNALLSGEVPDFGKQYYMHIFAVDNANNVSAETIVPIGRAGAKAIVTTDKPVYDVGDTVQISTSSTAILFDFTADAVLNLYDANGNLTAELVQADQAELKQEEPFTLNSSWLIPEIYSGTFTARIIWRLAGEEITAAETTFKVAENGAVTNSVNTDKTEYLAEENISILNSVSNLSTNADASDLSLKVTVSGEDQQEEMTFTNDIAVLYLGARMQYHEMIPAGTLDEGQYTVKADIVNDEAQTLSSDTTRFTVSSSGRVMTGSLDFEEKDENTQHTIYSVVNHSSTAVSGAVVTVTVTGSADGKTAMVWTDTVDFAPEQTLEFSKLLDTAALENGDYIGILSVMAGGTEAELANAQFTIERIVEESSEQESSQEESSEEESSEPEPSEVSEKEPSVVEPSEVSEEEPSVVEPSKDDPSVIEPSVPEPSERESTVAPESTVSRDESSTATGDNTGVLVMTLVLLMMAGGLTAIVIVGGKRKCE